MRAPLVKHGPFNQPPDDAAPGATPVLTNPDLFHAIWQQAADAMVLSDAHGIVLAANPAYLRLYGYAADVVVGHSFAIIFPPEQRTWAVDQDRQVFAGPASVPVVESGIRRADGTERVVQSHVAFLSAAGQRVAMLSTLRDSTDRTRRAAHAAFLSALDDEVGRLAPRRPPAPTPRSHTTPLSQVRGARVLISRSFDDPGAFLDASTTGL